MNNGWRDAEEAVLNGAPEVVLIDFFDTIAIRPSVSEKLYFRGAWGRNSIWRYSLYKLLRSVIIKATKKELNFSFYGNRLNTLMQNAIAEDFAELFIPTETVLILKNIIKSGKKIIVVSNTVVEKNLISQKLISHQISVHKIYTSSSAGIIKSQGLWAHVLMQEDLLPNQVIVIGDDLKEDLVPAETLGCKFYRIKTPLELLSPILSQKQLALFSDSGEGKFFLKWYVENCLMDSEFNLWESVGFLYSYLLSSYISSSLKDEMDSQLYKDVFFLSREGYFSFRIFQTIPMYSDVKSHYLFVSRWLLASQEGKEFIRTQISACNLAQREVAIFDIGWRGQSLSLVRSIGKLNAHGFFLTIWPWLTKPQNSKTLFGSRFNIFRTLTLRSCPEVLEFILSAPHQSMYSTKVMPQLPSSPEVSICRGFETALKEVDYRPDETFVSRYLHLLLVNPSRDQAEFFGNILHSINGESPRKLIDRTRILWLFGARAIGAINTWGIMTEIWRLLVSKVRTLSHG